MEDLLSVLGIILYLVVLFAGAKNKKNKKNKTSKKKAAGRVVRFDQAFESVLEQVSAAQQERTDRSDDSGIPAAAQQAEPPSAYQEGNDPCHDAMLTPKRPSIQLTHVTQETMENAGEGVDPCHIGQAPDDSFEKETSPVYRSPIFDMENRETFERDVLCGVVMSEVLKRPRAGMKRRA